MLYGLLGQPLCHVLIGDTLLFRLTEHVQDKSKLPILIFPEGESWREAPGGEGVRGQHPGYVTSLLVQPRALRAFSEAKGTL